MIEVHLRQNFEQSAIDVILIDRNPGGSVWLGPGGKREKMAESGTNQHREAFAVLPIDAAHALLGALSRHLGAVEHPEQLRADFDHLRKRHDLLVDHVLGEAYARRPRR